MLTPEVERLPPVTIEFLRVVCGVEAVHLACRGCDAVHVAPWADLGLPDGSPFPPAGRIWRCGRCGATDIAATLEPPAGSGACVALPRGTAIPPVASYAATDDFGAVSPELRGRLDAIVAQLSRAEG